MWTCKAVLPGGKVCETDNFDDWNQCSNCGAPQQANSTTTPEPEPSFQELGSNLITGAKSAVELGREKAKQYAPVASAVAQTAKAKAGDIVLHSRIATRTGVHIFSVIGTCLLLLIASAALPVLLHWPMTLTASSRSDTHQESEGFAQTQLLAGSTKESSHNYNGVEHVIVFVPSALTDPRRSKLVTAALLCGPMLISGTPVQLEGTGPVQPIPGQEQVGGGKAVGSVTLDLTNGKIFWFSALALLLLLFVADVLIGDIYAMQKVLLVLIGLWVGYAFLLAALAKGTAQELVGQLFPEVSVGLTMTGLMASAVKIGFIGLIYWMSSMLLRSLHQERTAAKAERRRLAVEADG